MLARDQRGEILGLLLGIAPAADLVDAQVRMRAVAEAERGRGPADFLDRDDVFEIAETQPAIGFTHGQAVQAELAHLAPQFLAREIVLAVDLLGLGGDLFVGEAGHGVADHFRAFAKLEIEIGGRAHALSLGLAKILFSCAGR